MKIIILYGEMGCGKSYHSSRLAWDLGWTVLEGDDCIPEEMAQRIKSFRPIPLEMIQSYLLDYLVPAIQTLDGHRGLVVAQALYRRDHRELVSQKLQELGHEVELRRIESPFLRHMKQLWGRPQGFRWVLYGLLSKPFFQP
jgi:gluconate kinase